MAKKKRRRGIFLNRKGTTVWWCRVKLPGGQSVRRSTETESEQVAYDIANVVLPSLAPRREFELLRAAYDGRLSLLSLYQAFYEPGGMGLVKLRERLNDANLEPHIATWVASMEASESRSEKTIHDYEYEVRSLMGDGTPFYYSQLTEKRIMDWLAGLDRAPSTKRRYFDALRTFVKWATRNVPLPANPMEQIEEIPQNADPRAIYFEHGDVLKVLDAMPETDARSIEAKLLVTLLFGTGMELGAAYAAKGADVVKADRAIFAHGTKSGYRERMCFVDKWAWERIKDHVTSALPTAPLFQLANRDFVRDTFYQAQVDAGLRPPLGEGVTPFNAHLHGVQVRGHFHTLHDCRHSFCVNRTLGLDGEEKRDLQYLADQLGHADTVMVSRVYNKFRLRDRLEAQKKRDAQQGQPAQEAQA